LTVRGGGGTKANTQGAWEESLSPPNGLGTQKKVLPDSKKNQATDKGVYHSGSQINNPCM